MSHNPTRNDKTCLNCYNPNVEERYCPKCGQENIESRMSLKGVVIHFLEDLTHYDNAFWKTIKYLLFNPAKLTLEYLSGRRKIFVPPIKLYFFISFITFFLPSVLPDIDTENEEKAATTKEINATPSKSDDGVSVFGSRKYKSVKELDSIESTLPDNKKMGFLKYQIVKAAVNSNEHKSSGDFSEKFDESFSHNLPKAIFIYLPIFGFWLWVFHGKKRWFFFDHAIFTFHYFGFLLLFLTISITFFERIYSLLPVTIYDKVSMISGILTCSWIIVYFYIAHKRMYRETRWISFLKSTFLLLINISFIIAIMIGLAVYSLINIH